MLLRENYTAEHILRLREETGADPEYSGRFYTACPVMETVDSGMMETAIPEMQNQ